MHRVQTLILAALCALTAISAEAPLQAQKKKATARSAAAKKIDINTASAAELIANLQGIGQKRAKAIVKARSKRRFKTTDDLLEVPGIGPAIIAKNLGKLSLPRGKRALTPGKGRSKAKAPTKKAAKKAAKKPAKKAAKRPLKKAEATGKKAKSSSRNKKTPAKAGAAKPKKKSSTSKRPTKKSTPKSSRKGTKKKSSTKKSTAKGSSK